VTFLLLFILLAFLAGLRGADRPTTRAWPLVALACGLATLYLSYEMI
jgi:hypothetical protein